MAFKASEFFVYVRLIGKKRDFLQKPRLVVSRRAENFRHTLTQFVFVSRLYLGCFFAKVFHEFFNRYRARINVVRQFFALDFAHCVERVERAIKRTF